MMRSSSPSPPTTSWNASFRIDGVSLMGLESAGGSA
jgi:hypothetical protein